MVTCAMDGYEATWETEDGMPLCAECAYAAEDQDIEVYEL